MLTRHLFINVTNINTAFMVEQNEITIALGDDANIVLTFLESVAIVV
jgi:hypothetical protein